MEPVPVLSESGPKAAPAVHGPDWRLVAVFYAVNFAWVSLVALGVYLVSGRMSAATTQLVFLFGTAFLYMPAPLVAALIAERVGKRRPLIRTTFAGFGRKLPRLLLTFVGLSAATYVTYVLLAVVFGNVLNAPGVGQLAGTQADLERAVTALIPPLAEGAATPAADPALNLPPVGLLYVLALFSGLTAGLTVNGLFAFGEEYGWRGFLMDELRPLGDVRANLLTGVLWGLWHAPVVLLGYDYAPHRWLGVMMMVVLCTPLSFVLWRARQFTDSLLAPAILHGAFNGYGGFFVILLVGRDPAVSLPIGVLGAAGTAVVALAFWKWSEGRLAEGSAA